MKLYTYPGNSRAFKALITAQYCTAARARAIEVPEFQMGLTNATDAFLALNPYGQVPALETDDGRGVFESTAIARYVAATCGGEQLLGGDDPVVRARVDSFCDAAMWHLDRLSDFTVNPLRFPAYFKADPGMFEYAMAELKRALLALDAHLATHTFLVGERVTLADICMSMTLLRFVELVCDPVFLSDVRSVKRWFFTCIRQPQFTAVIGDDFKVCQRRPDFAKLAAVENGKPEASGVSSATQAATNEPDAGEEGGDKKAKNPLDLLPKSSFNLENAKRLYSNAEDSRGAMNKIWDELFDYDGYSVWIVRYMYNHELAKTFMSSNLLNGWFQRMDHMRKYMFGSMLVFGKSGAPGDCEIGGAFIVRGGGEQLPDPVLSVDDVEHYVWRKADVKGSDRELVNDCFAWEGKFEGMADKPVASGKVFK